MPERSIAGSDLMRSLPEVLEEIAHRGTVFLVNMGKAPPSSGVIGGCINTSGEIVFALGPPQVLGGVFGLIDEEYGWPSPVQVEEVEDLLDLMPSHRRHPMFCRGNDCIAMSISLGEYDLLVGKRPQQEIEGGA
jgi:hypothetical protein